MELGYGGIAYNRTIKGVTESDRCSIPPFSLSSLLKISPSLSSSVSFHRRLLGVPENSPFRQYTRLTVLIETSAQASALNSSNPILKTYDFVAVRPLNQNSFDHACQFSQVDLISIDFAEKLPFRLKLPMVKAAIARGVYFEITYSSLMEDVQVRRQMISNAKLLVEWTRGKNVIVSSAAPSVLELRGPNCVANLSSLIGLSNECAKAAISKNCRLLITNALRKKHFYKEAIRVEVMPANGQTDPKEPWIVDYLDWDPISSGEGDLHLDDMAKSFAKSDKVTQNVKAIDIASIDVPSHGLQVKDISLGVEGSPQRSGTFLNFMSTSKDLETINQTEKLHKKPTSAYNNLLDSKDSQQAMLLGSATDSPSLDEFRIASTTSLHELEKSDTLGASISLTEVREPELQNHVASHAEDLQFNESIMECSTDLKVEVSIKNDHLCCPGEMQSSDQSLDNTSLSRHLSKLKEDSVLDTNSTALANEMMDLDTFVERKGSDGLGLGECHRLEEVAEEREHREQDKADVKTDTEASLATGNLLPVNSFCNREDSENLLTAEPVFSEDMVVDAGKQVEETKNQSSDKSGRHKVRRLASGQVLRFPFKRLFQVQFKKKSRASLDKKSKKR